MVIIPVSVFIDMTYRQVIATNGVPFELKTSRALVTFAELRKRV